MNARNLFFMCIITQNILIISPMAIKNKKDNLLTENNMFIESIIRWLVKVLNEKEILQILVS